MYLIKSRCAAVFRNLVVFIIYLNYSLNLKINLKALNRLSNGYDPSFIFTVQLLWPFMCVCFPEHRSEMYIRIVYVISITFN
jgi:hypothetical protein